MKILSSINYYINIAKNKYTTVSYSVCLGCCGKIMAKEFERKKHSQKYIAFVRKLGKKLQNNNLLNSL